MKFRIYTILIMLISLCSQKQKDINLILINQGNKQHVDFIVEGYRENKFTLYSKKGVCLIPDSIVKANPVVRIKFVNPSAYAAFEQRIYFKNIKSFYLSGNKIQNLLVNNADTTILSLRVRGSRIDENFKK